MSLPDHPPLQPDRAAERRARVRARWTPPPGPLPAGDGGDPALRPGEGETLDALAGEWRIFQRRDGHRYSTDDLLTAWYGASLMAARGVDVQRYADLGAGIGSVTMIAAWRLRNAQVLAIEAQALSAGLCARSQRYNGLDSRVTRKLGDRREATFSPEYAGWAELVTGSPPYIPEGRGTVSQRPQCDPCRFERRVGLELRNGNDGEGLVSRRHEQIDGKRGAAALPQRGRRRAGTELRDLDEVDACVAEHLQQSAPWPRVEGEGLPACEVHVFGGVGSRAHAELVEENSIGVGADEHGARAKEAVIVQARQGCEGPPVHQAEALSAEHSQRRNERFQFRDASAERRGRRVRSLRVHGAAEIGLSLAAIAVIELVRVEAEAGGVGPFHHRARGAHEDLVLALGVAPKVREEHGERRRMERVQRLGQAYPLYTEGSGYYGIRRRWYPSALVSVFWDQRATG